MWVTTTNLSSTISEEKAGRALDERTAQSAELDDATQMYYYGARYYDPRISIFVSVDPLAEHPKQIGSSPYIYVANNPINLIDPTGMIWERPEDKKRLESDIKSKIKSHEGEIANLTESLTNETKEKRINSINNKIKDYEERIGLLNQSLHDIEMLDQDSRSYFLEDLPESETNSFVHGVGDKIYIQGTNTGEHLHEIRHVGQFLQKGRNLKFVVKNGYNRLTNAGKDLEQISDNEVEAYKIQAAYSGNGSVGMQGVNFIKDIDASKINRNKRFSNGSPMYPLIERFLKLRFN